MSYTPGPWKPVHWGDGTVHGIRSLNPNKLICSILPSLYRNKKNTSFEIMKNADLLASAPELLAALQKAVSDYGKPGGPWNVPSEPGTWLHMAQTAIANATGTEPPKENGVV